MKSKKVHLAYQVTFRPSTSSFADVTTRVTWMLSWRMKMRITRLGSRDLVFLDPCGIFETWTDLNLTWRELQPLLLPTLFLLTI